MVTNLTRANEFLKLGYRGPVRNQLNNMAALYFRIEKNSDDVVDVGGEALEAVLDTFYRRNQGIGWRGESGTLPTAGAVRHAKPKVAMAFLYGSLKFTGPALVASRKESDRFAKTMDTEVRRMTEGVKQEVNRTMFGRGTGAMARITGATDVAVGTFFSVDDASRLEEGMKIDTFTTNAGSGGTAGFDSKTIDKVDYINNKIAMEEDLSAAASEINDYIYREDSRGLTAMGLEGIADGTDGDGARLITTFEGLSRATHQWWNANVLDNSGVKRDLGLDLVQQGVEIGEIVGGGTTSVIISNYSKRRKYLDRLVADRRYVNFEKYDGGWKGLEYTGGGSPIPWFVDKHCQKGVIYCLDESSLAVYRAADFDWMDRDGAILSRVSTKDEYEATLYCYMNFGTHKSNSNTVIRDLN